METQAVTEDTCRHHWVLSPPREGWIDGRCKKCGEKRRYPAALDDYDHGDDESDGRLSDLHLVATAGGGARPSPPED